MLLLFTFHIGRNKGIISLEKQKEHLREISAIPEKMADFIKMLTAESLQHVIEIM